MSSSQAQSSGTLDLLVIERLIRILESAKNISDRIFDLFPVAFLLTDDDGLLLKVNELAQKLLGGREEEMLGCHIIGMAPEGAKAKLKKHYEESLAHDQQVSTFESKIGEQGEGSQYIFWQLHKVAKSGNYRSGLHIIVASDITQLRQHHERILAIEQELQVSQAVQVNLLPASAEYRDQNFHIAGYYRAADKVGGDWWWYETRDRGRLQLLVGDVTGHGVGAAMVTAKIAAAYRVVSRKAPLAASMLELLVELNRHIAVLNDPLHSMSLFAASFSPEDNLAELCFCGANPVSIFKPDGRQVNFLEGGDLLGWHDEVRVGVKHGEFARGDRLLAYTDGAFEFVAKSGLGFNYRRLLKVAAKYRGHSASAALAAMAAEIDQLRGGYYKDDMSLVIVDRL